MKQTHNEKVARKIEQFHMKCKDSTAFLYYYYKYT